MHCFKSAFQLERLSSAESFTRLTPEKCSNRHQNSSAFHRNHPSSKLRKAAEKLSNSKLGSATGS
jgi:hypothetical protein